MNRHQRLQAKRARRAKRTTGKTRGKVRGPVTRGAARAALMHDGEGRIFAMVRSTRTPTVAARMKTNAQKLHEEQLSTIERLARRIGAGGQRDAA